MKLVRYVRKWHSLWSIRFIILSAFFSAIIAAYALLPADWLPTIPEVVKKWLAIADLLSAGAAGVSRVIKQNVTGDGHE